MDTSPINYSKIRNIFVIITAFFVTVWIYSSVKSFFQHYFTNIEKRQMEIMAELKTIKAEIKIAPSASPSFVALQDIGKMREELTKLKNQMREKDDILGLLDAVPTSTPSPTKKELSSLHLVTISNSQWQTVDVFQDKNSSSRIVGQAVYNKYYPYSKKESGYYYIALSETVYGWIHSQFVKEY